MPDNKIRIVRPDGTVFEGTDKELERLQLLGNYHAEDTREARYAAGEAQTKEDYTTGTEKLKTFGEGALSGATFGLSDLALNSDRSDLRAKYNPGTRLAGELTGGLATAGIPGAPAELLSRGATAAGERVGTGLLGKAVTGGIEGAGYGLQSEISNAELTNTPLDTERLIAGVGMGTLFGAGINAGLHKVGQGLEKFGKKIEPEKATAQIEDEIQILNEDNYAPFRSNIRDNLTALEPVEAQIEGVTKQIKDIKAQDAEMLNLSKNAIDVEKSALQDTVKGKKKAFGDFLKQNQKEATSAAGEIKASETALDNISKLEPEIAKQKVVVDELKAKIGGATNKSVITKLSKKLEPELEKLVNMTELGSKFGNAADHQAAIDVAKGRLSEIKGRDFEKLHSTKIAQHQQNLGEMQAALENFQPTDISVHEGEIKRLVGIRDALNELKVFPNTAKEFAGMQTAKTEKMTAAVESILGSDMKELQPLQDSLKQSVDGLIKSTGIRVDGSIGTQLRNIQNIAKTANTIKVVKEVDAITKKHKYNPMEAFAKWQAASSISKGIGIGHPGYLATRALLSGVEGLAGIKGAVQSRLSKAAKGIGKAFQSSRTKFVAPALEPLYTKIDGTRDPERNFQKAATNRVNEITQMAPVANNVLYNSLEHLVGTQLDTASKMLDTGTKAFNTLLDLLPKPGHTMVGFKNTAVLSPVDALVAAKTLNAFHRPIEVLENAMKGNVDTIEMKTIQAVYPELVNQARHEIMLYTDFSSMGLADQEAMSILLGTPISDAFDPRNFVDAQAAFAATPTVNTGASGQKGGGVEGNSGGRPPAVNNQPNASLTPAQDIISNLR